MFLKVYFSIKRVKKLVKHINKIQSKLPNNTCILYFYYSFVYVVIFNRVYVENDNINSIKLYLTRIYEGDAGLYTCQYEKNGVSEMAYIKLSLYGKSLKLFKLCNTVALSNQPLKQEFVWNFILLTKS